MNFSDFFKSKDNIQLDKKTLVVLRWLALIGQYITISIVFFVLNLRLQDISKRISTQGLYMQLIHDDIL